MLSRNNRMSFVECQYPYQAFLEERFSEHWPDPLLSFPPCDSIFARFVEQYSSRDRNTVVALCQSAFAHNWIWRNFAIGDSRKPLGMSNKSDLNSHCPDNFHLQFLFVTKFLFMQNLLHNVRFRKMLIRQETILFGVKKNSRSKIVRPIVEFAVRNRGLIV